MPCNSPLIKPDGRRGFTLIEVLVAVLITAAIAGAAAVATSRALAAQDQARARGQAMSRATLVVDRIAADVQTLVRSGDLYDARVLLVDATIASGAARASSDDSSRYCTSYASPSA